MKFTFDMGPIVQICPIKDQICELSAEPRNSACFFKKACQNSLFNYSISCHDNGMGSLVASRLYNLFV